MRIAVSGGELRIQNLRTRMPFRYGIATMSVVPHVVVQLTVEVDGQSATGRAADHLPPKWFTKDPHPSYADDVRDMLGVILHAVELVQTLPPAGSVFGLWQSLYAAQKQWGNGRGFPPLLWSFGVSLVERAVIEAFCRARRITFADALRSNAFRIELRELYPELSDRNPSELLPKQPLESIHVRHTVGLTDPLTAAEIPAEERVNDGLPQSLEDCIRTYGLRFLKIKLSGDIARDRDRLHAIARLMHSAETCHFTLDGNENYRSVAPFRVLWEELRADPALASFLRGLIFVEQPFHRDIALSESTCAELRAWTDRPPIIIDESDGEVGTLATALASGYAGTSHKNCKGIFKGVANACLVADRRRLHPESPSQMSAEDLSNVGPIALLQDLAVIASLGITHAERNGHHYFAGLQQFAPEIQRPIASAHPDLLCCHADGYPMVRVEQGSVSVRTVVSAPFGVGCDLPLAGFVPLAEWQVDSLG